MATINTIIATKDESVVKEVKYLMKMAVNWRRSFEKWLTPFGDNQWVYEEFGDEINVHLRPYLGRMMETEYISMNDSTAIVAFFYEQIEYLMQLVKEMEDAIATPIDYWRF